VTDGGGIFYSNRAMAIYEALDIRKERIDPRQSWQNYIEAHFGIMRRLADYYLNKAPTLDEMKKAHRKFIRNYNTQIHFAHRERQDGRHSPQDVLRGVLARTLPAETLARIFFATECTRHLDRSGYIRFRRSRFYAEEGLARQQVQVSIYTSTLKIEYQATELAFYTMEWAEDNKHIKEVKNPRLIETGYRSPQLTLWTLGPDEWLLFLKLRDYAPRRRRREADVIQLLIPELLAHVEQKEA
jgi:putative transposase